MIVDAIFTSVWDGGTKINSSCKVNLETKEVFNITAIDPDDMGIEVETLDREYVTIDGKEHSVGRTSNEPSDAEFWYD